MRIGLERREDIISASSENTAPRFRLFSKRRQGLILKLFVLFTAPFLRRTSATI
jgi:hypothetical protein